MTKRSQRTLLALCIGLGLAAASCSSTPSRSAGTRADATGSFPTAVAAANGIVHIKARPRAIVSLSPTATEMLYAIGAGSQVKAVDKYSDYPKSAPRTTLDDLQPNVEAIVSYRPDLVVVPGDSSGLTGRLKAFGIPVLSLPPATTLAEAYAEYGELGRATGHVRSADAEAAHVKAQVAQIVTRSATVQRGPDVLLRARPDLLLGDIVDLRRTGAGSARAAQHRGSRPFGRVQWRLSAAVG